MARFCRNILRGLSASLVLLAALAAPCTAAEPVYTFGVTPQFDQVTLFGIWRPIIAELERRAGMRLKLVSAVTVPEFERAIRGGVLDFAVLNPFLLAHDGERSGYIPLLRDEAPYHGVIVVPRDSPINTLADLEGKTLAIPAFNALAGSLAIQADLAQAGVSVKLAEMKTHSGAYAAAVHKQADAASGADRTLAKQPAAVQEALRIIHTTGEVPGLPLVAQQRVPEAHRRRLVEALLALDQDPAGHALLLSVPVTRLVPASWDDYRGLASRGFAAYWRETKE